MGSKKTLFLSAQIIIAIICIIMFILSGTQTSSTTINSASHELPNRKNGNPCSETAVFANHRPMRFQFNDDDEYLKCPWSSSNSALRMTSCILACIIIVYSAYKTWKGDTFILWLAILVNLGMALISFIAMCMDANDVRKSKSWCGDGMDGVPWESFVPTIKCEYGPYIVTILMDALLMILWVANLYLTWKYTRHWQDEEDHEVLDDAGYSTYNAPPTVY